jgi:hypothetical protein
LSITSAPASSSHILADYTYIILCGTKEEKGGKLERGVDQRKMCAQM